MAADNPISRLRAAAARQLLYGAQRISGRPLKMIVGTTGSGWYAPIDGAVAVSSADYYGGALYGESQTAIRANKFGSAFIVAHNEAAMRCVSKIANTVGGTPWEIVDTRTDRPVATSDDRHPKHFIARVIREYEFREHENLFTQWALALAVAGENYIELMPSEYRWMNHRTAGLQWLNPLAVTKDVHGGQITCYRYDAGIGAETVEFNVDEIAYDRHGYDLRTDIDGHPPLASGAMTASVVRNAGLALMAHFGNGAFPGMVVSPKDKPGGISPNDWERLQRKLGSEFKGVRNKGTPLLLGFPLDVAVLNEPALEHWVEIIKKLESGIYTAFGVPRSVAGDSDTQRYQAAPDDKERFGYTALEYINGIEAHFNAVIAPELDPEGEHILRFDRSAFHTVSREAVDIATARLAGGYSTINEAREAAGLEAVKGGDVIAVPLSVQFAKVERTEDGEMVLQLPPLVAPALTPQTADEIAPTADAVTDDIESEDDVDAVKDTGVEVFIGLDLANNPDLISLQQQVKTLAGDDGDWYAPSDFHVTLLYAPVVDEATAATFMREAQAVQTPELTLKVGSLNSFDSVGKWAVHFAIRLNADLLDYQESLYELALTHGIAVSSYSVPSNYKPHITMGYTPEKLRQTFRGNLTVTPSGVIYDIDEEPFEDGVPDDMVTQASADDADSERRQKAVDELLTWQRVTRKQPTKAFAFNDVPVDVQARIAKALADGMSVDAVYDMAYALTADDAPPKVKAAIDSGQVDRLPALTQTYARHLADASVDDSEVLKAALTRHCVSIMAAKAIQSTRIDFEDGVEDLLTDALAGRVERRRFGIILRSLIETAVRRAYRDGLEDGGVKDADFDDDDIVWIEDWLDEQRQYVVNLADAIYKDERVTQDEVLGKPVMWWNRSVAPAYAEALTSAARNAAFERILGNTEEHCRDCSAINGQVRRASFWRKIGVWDSSDKTECGGWRCLCLNRPTDKPISRGRFPKLVGPRRKSADRHHEHRHHDDSEHSEQEDVE